MLDAATEISSMLWECLLFFAIPYRQKKFTHKDFSNISEQRLLACIFRSQIRSVMRLTGAHIRIETTSPLQNGSGDGVGDRDTGAEGDGPTSGRENEPVVNGGSNSNDSTATAAGAINGQESLSDEEKYQAGGDHNRRRSDLQADSNERRVTITGTDQQQYKAQFWIFQRICEQGYHFFDEVRLCTEIQVPSKMVGRIIGKGGQNVRELQRVTGAQVKIPDDVAHDSPEDTIVRIIGNFNATQAVQARIRQLLHLMHNRTGGN
uniref:K Homology domain-containing protein n=1 Tax=Romanomermis culicivorax TaxID=13658 RepID=A0A915IA37_ROMCU